jgi:hypothetical protein
MEGSVGVAAREEKREDAREGPLRAPLCGEPPPPPPPPRRDGDGPRPLACSGLYERHES